VTSVKLYLTCLPFAYPFCQYTAGREDCYVYSRKRKALVWLPAFYLYPSRIVEPTGVGNIFLGGFAVDLMDTEDDLVAGCYGTVASSFALEHIGIPVHQPPPAYATGGAKEAPELWNWTIVHDRLNDYTSQVGIALGEYTTAILTTRSEYASIF
jgi:hypothetical protein